MTKAEIVKIQTQSGSLKRPLYGPARFKAVAKPVVGDAEVPCPFGDSHRLPVTGYNPGSAGCPRHSAVVGLFGWCCPSAVFWGVRPVVVDSVDRRSDRLVSHVSVKINKRLEPRITHSNPPPSVIRVAGVVGASASPYNPSPCAVLPRAQKAVRRIAAQAAASVSCRLLQIIGCAGEKTTTVADAQPNGVAAPINFDRRNGHRPAKYLAAEILCAIGKWYHLASHFGTCNIELARWARAFTPRLPSIIPATGRSCWA